MSSAADLANVIQHLRIPAGGAPSDPELLDRYARGHDQTAFAALVRRYGPLVLGVARRQVADRHRAEDVFQATFLALARSAAKLGGRPVLANWLYTVALRQGRKARARSARRAELELTAPPRLQSGNDPLDVITGRELLLAIDDELARLPDRLRLPILLCYVQGYSREEAARWMGCTDGAVRGLLERGRRRLAARLAARGLAPSALILAPLAAVTIPADLAARTAEQAATPWSKAVPIAVAELAATSAARSLIPIAAMASCVLAAGLVAWSVASGRDDQVQPAQSVRTVQPAAQSAKAAADDPLPTGATMRFGSSRYRHPTAIENLAVSPDGKFAVASSGGRFNGAFRIYDLTTGRVVLNLESEPGDSLVDAVTFSPDGKTLAMKQNFSVRLYDPTTGKENKRIEYPGANPSTTTAALVFSPDGKKIVVAAADGRALHLIDLAKGKVERTLPHAHVVYAAAFSPDGKHIVAGGYDSDKNLYFARLWETATGNELRRLPFGNGGIRCIAYSPDGASIAIGGDGGMTPAVKLFAAATGKERLAIPFPDSSSVKSVAFTPDGKTLAASGRSSTRLFDTTTGNETLKIDLQATGLRFAPDGKSLVGAVAGTIYRWDAATGQSLIPEGGDSPIAQIELISNGKRLVTRGQDGDAHIWDAWTDEHLRRINVAWQRGLAVSSDGQFLIWPTTDESVKFKVPDEPNTIYYGNRLQMRDLTTGKQVERFAGFEGDADDLFFTVGGKKLVMVDHRDGAVRFWDVATGKVERSFRAAEKGTHNQVWHSRLSPDGKVLAVTYQPSGRGIFSPFPVKLYDTATGKELYNLPGHMYYVEAMAFSADSKYLMTGSNELSKFAQKQLKLAADQVFVWDVETGKAVARLPIGGTAGAFAPDGKTLAIANEDGTIQLWDTATWKVTGGEFRGPRARVTTLAFGPDGQLYSGSVDATAFAWDPKLAKAPLADRK